MLELPRVIGHRGAKSHAPENTLASIRLAHAQGARWVEVDVKLTADGAPILMHDDRVERTTDGQGAVREMTLAELRRLDAGRWFSAEYAGERVPTLEEFLDLAAGLGLGINLEIKPCAGREGETARTALETARRYWRGGLPVLVSSFAVESLEAAMAVAPDWPRGYLMDEEAPDWRAVADRLAAATINVNAKRQTAETVAAYRATGRPVLCYTVNDPERARVLLDWGVSAVFTDAPREMLAGLGA
ncbi:glycerophosphodiester phosphodiesterase [Arenibaculum pallidiluteum]|uniref:glycerophosphodiester phosphodiesterase n=1 Tax=Arenibaculum pallidiluteum TaxID=2812559 RepID=UPI001A9703E1|nr:glycerophosphodiester phosphodiesterase [Arenibaculum pallidiluteum]